MKRPVLPTIEQAIARIEHASPKATERTARSLTAVAQIEKRLPEGQDDLPHGEAMAAYREAMAATGLSQSSVCNAWTTRTAWAKAAPKQKRSETILRAMLTPRWPEWKRKSLVASLPELPEAILREIVEHRNFTSHRALAKMILDDLSLDSGKLRTLTRYVARFRHQYAPEIKIATDPDGARGSLAPAFGNMRSGLTPLALVELDGSRSDLNSYGSTMDTKSGRRQVILMIDRATSVQKAIIADSESGPATGRALTKFFLEVGLPGTVLTDHGRGFTSEHVRLILLRLGVGLELAPPFRGDRKPFVERGIGTIQRFYESLPGFVGHNPVERQRLRSYLPMSRRRGRSEEQVLGVELTDAELQERLDRFLDSENSRPRKYLGGKSPVEVLADWIADGGAVRRPQDPAAVWQLLHRVGAAKVGKKGLRFKGRDYICRDLAELTGHWVEFARCPNLRDLAVFAADDERRPVFNCIARPIDAFEPEEQMAEALAAGDVFRARCGRVNRIVRAAKRRGRTGRDEAHKGATPSATPYSNVVLAEFGKAVRRAIAGEAEEPGPRQPSEEQARHKYLALKRKPADSLSERERLFLALYRNNHPFVDDEIEAAS